VVENLEGKELALLVRIWDASEGEWSGWKHLENGEPVDGITATWEADFSSVKVDDLTPNAKYEFSYAIWDGGDDLPPVAPNSEAVEVLTQFVITKIELEPGDLFPTKITIEWLEVVGAGYYGLTIVAVAPELTGGEDQTVSFLLELGRDVFVVDGIVTLEYGEQAELATLAALGPNFTFKVTAYDIDPDPGTPPAIILNESDVYVFSMEEGD